MATYVNDSRLKEIATGDESGTWGTSTNTNLELIAEAFSYGTEAITTNADTHTTTIADGSTDPGRSIYLKYTGTLDSACTITIGPNTVSKLWFIENGTSGSQNIIISQGSGASITIPAGDVKVVYSDGAGSGAAVVDAFASLSVVDLKVQDDLTVTDDMTVGGTLGVTGVVTANAGVVVDNITIDGTEIDLSSGDLTLDVAGDIILDADGADIKLLNDGTHWGSLYTNATPANLYLQNMVSDGDIYLSGSDGGSNINALVLDMSAAGAATFNSTINGVGISSDISNFSQSILISQDAGTGTLSTASNNTGLGYEVFNVLTSGDDNTGLGRKAFLNLTTGSNNVAIGSGAMADTTTGSSNTTVGQNAGSGITTADNNTAVGASALAVNTTGTENVAVGKGAGDALTTGGYNTVVGTDALSAATTSTFNTAIGRNALLVCTTGASNVAVGGQALDANTTASNNTAVGTSSLSANTTGEGNTALGQNTLSANTTGGNNVALGINALSTNTTGSYQVAIGRNSLLNSDGVDKNVAVGYNTLQAVTTGNNNIGIGYVAADAITTGSDNTAVGQSALTSATTASYNTCVGSAAGDVITTGAENTCLGYDAGGAITTGNNNTMIGRATGAHDTNLTTGSQNIIIGDFSDVSSSSALNQILIGYNISASQNNQFRFGKPSNTVHNNFDTDASWTRSSDVHKKTNIDDDTLGLDFINDLRTVTYNWKPNSEFPKHYDDYYETENHMDTETKMHGMIAQEIKTALDKQGVDTFGGWSEEKDGSQRISQEMFVHPLIKAVQELSTQVNELKAEIKTLKGE